MSTIARFYDGLADDYHLNYADWHEAVPRQGRVLAQLIRNRLGNSDAETLLDCSCGIGTQAIGLALEGFDVTGTDLSPKSVARARREAAAFGVTVEWSVADVRNLTVDVPGTFDVVISCDNSLPHLLTDDELALALANMYAKVGPGGLLVIGIRDYDALSSERPRFTPPRIIEKGDSNSVLFQHWDWVEDGSSYDVTLFMHKRTLGAWTSRTHTATYRALQRDELAHFASQAGVSDIQWSFPDVTGHHQPLMTARKPLETEDIHDCI